MIAFVHGELALADPSQAVVDCHGVGYALRISLNTYSAIAGKARVKLHTHYHQTDGPPVLYGFAEAGELEVFRKLLEVNGVGGSTALALLGALSPAELHSAIEHEDVARLKRVKGVGEKTASRIVLELKGKLPQGGAHGGGTSLRAEALAALQALGMPKTAMEQRLDALLAQPDGPRQVEDLVRAALKGP